MLLTTYLPRGPAMREQMKILLRVPENVCAGGGRQGEMQRLLHVQNHMHAGGVQLLLYACRTMCMQGGCTWLYLDAATATCYMHAEPYVCRGCAATALCMQNHMHAGGRERRGVGGEGHGRRGQGGHTPRCTPGCTWMQLLLYAICMQGARRWGVGVGGGGAHLGAHLVVPAGCPMVCTRLRPSCPTCCWRCAALL